MDITLTKKEPSRILIIAAFAAIYVIWGSTYLAMLIAIRDIPPFIMLGTRFLIAGLLLFVFAILRGDSLPDTKSVGKISLSGILMLCLGTGAVAWVEQYIPSGLAAIIVATVPLWFALLDKRQWRFNFTNKWIISGLIIGFVGVLLLFTDKKASNITGDRMQLISFFVMIGGTITWAIGSLYAKYQESQGTPVMKASLQMLAAGIGLLLIGFFSGEQNKMDLSSISRESIWALVYLITIGSLVGYMAYVWLLTVRPPTLVGTYAYVNPVVAVFLGWLIADELISMQQVLALGVILLGVILVTLSNYKKQ